MSMEKKLETTDENLAGSPTKSDFHIGVSIQYIESESKPENNYHFFAYRISIKNQGKKSAQLLSRHWIITDEFGQTEEVRGAGVVGLQPKIDPGQDFQYESACPLATKSGSMKGSYQFVDEDGNSFNLEIPEFFLISPMAIH